ncbi:polysaccharide biosynthesis/export family protein [bacterium]|nr:polysaccharide biosynthesis/export family protein [bacterium]
MAHPPYVIEPPDILQLDLIAAIPKAPYRIRPLDVIGVVVPGALPTAPVSGPFTVNPEGTADLGSPYGAVPVAGMTLEEARAAIEAVLGKQIKLPAATVTLVQTRAIQQVRGPHLVRADGVIGLGSYGSVSVVGLTLPEAKQAIEAHLREFFQDPEVSLDIVGYNSKIYYVVFDYGGAGQQVIRLPITGNETVLDGVGQVNGLPTVADPRRIWVSRPSPGNCGPQILPVDWKAIVEEGDTRTNYQLLAGDRVFVNANPLVTADITLARVISPIERLFGITLLGSATVNSIRTNGTNNGNFIP